MARPELMPQPRRLRLIGGRCVLSGRVEVRADPALPPGEVDFQIDRLNAGLHRLVFHRRRPGQRESNQTLLHLALRPDPDGFPAAARGNREAHGIEIGADGIRLTCLHTDGLRAGVATLCQLLRQYGGRPPCLVLFDWPDFPRRGVLLDISRGRVPNLDTLKRLATDLAGFKINELQLYVEHTFAYRRHRAVWKDWGAVTGLEIRRLDAHCRSLGIDLVPNQNSLGHLRHWLEHGRFKPLAEVPAPYPGPGGAFLRYPSTLAPKHPGTLPFLRGLYDELLPNFTSRHFNVGCDEPWDLGRGQSQAICRRRGAGRVYLDHLRRVQREARRRGKTMMFWGDIILNHPHLIRELPRDAIALNWGYESDHPFEKETRRFAAVSVPFYVCPGTSTWQTLIGRNDNAFPNLRAAARAGKRHGAAGYLIADWGDGGHLQPLIVSYPSFIVGAALAWRGDPVGADRLAAVLSREIFHDPTGAAARALLNLGIAHRRFGFREPNATPFGAALAAPPSGQRELFCRNGLKYYAHLSGTRIRSAAAAVNRERRRLDRAKPGSGDGKVRIAELDLAARMAAESCRYLLWQKALAAGRTAAAGRLARTGIRNLEQIRRDVTAAWPRRHKGTAAHSVSPLEWRIRDYETSRLHYTPTRARLS